jgi:pyruvate dehydrogenase E2 component (dihydrolipoamide acetyltransferase)
VIQEVKFADIGEGVQEGELLSWHVKVGDNVKEDQTLAEIYTEKVTVEIAAPADGVVESLEKSEGDIIEVGDVLAKIQTAESVTPESTSASTVISTDPSLFKPTRPFQETRQTKDNYPHPTLAAPAVRKKARELDIDISSVVGSGPGGRILFEDLDAHTQSIAEGPKVHQKSDVEQILEERIPLRGVRRAVARNLRKSKSTAAHFTYHDEVDLTSLDKLRDEANALAEGHHVKLTYLPFIVKCLIPALREFPILNSSLDDEREEIVIKRNYNIGIAVDTEDGLIVPVIKNADRKNIWELAEEIEDLAGRARTGKLKLNEVQGGTFTVSSVGNIGGLMATPIIRWPEAAILGVMRGKLRPVAVVVDGVPKVEIRKMMFLSVSIDHRIVDGAVVARFMNRLIQYIENPGLMLLSE